MPTKKVWVQVEVETRSNGQGISDTVTNELVGGFDPEVAKQDLQDLLEFTPGYGPSEMFNDKNPMFSPRKSVADVATSRGVEYNTVAGAIRDDRLTWIREMVTQGSRSESWALIQMEKVDAIVLREMESTGQDQRYLDVKAKAMGITPERLLIELLGDEDCPFFSERYLYPLVGKDIARSVLGHVEALKRSMGVRPRWL